MNTPTAVLDAITHMDDATLDLTIKRISRIKLMDRTKADLVMLHAAYTERHIREGDTRSFHS